MTLKSPSPLFIFLCLLMFGFGELAGALLGGFPEPIQKFAAHKAQERPKVHGLTGIEDIDRTMIGKISSEVLSRLHTFHLHGHGVGLLAFILFTVLANGPFSNRVQRLLVLLTLLGMLYPFGWLTLMLLIPYWGTETAFSAAEKFFFAPFGSSLLVAIWLTILFYGIGTLKSLKRSAVNEV